MSADHFGWLLPAWLLVTPLLVAFYELAAIGSRRHKLGGGVGHVRDQMRPDTMGGRNI